MQKLSSHCKNKKIYRAIIAEDEAVLAQGLAKSLQSLWPNLEIVKICHEGKTALNILETQAIDIAFLDISMPFKTGMEIAEHCTNNNIDTLFVMVTAYPDYALQAFQYNICDYLLKPLCSKRLAETLLRLQERLQDKDNKMKLQSAQTLQRLSVQKGNTHQLIPINNVCYFMSDQKYVKVVTEKEEFLIRKSLAELEAELNNEQFWRVHRSNIININHLKNCKKTLTGRLEISFQHCADKIIVSRKYLHKFKSL